MKTKTMKKSLCVFLSIIVMLSVFTAAFPVIASAADPTPTAGGSGYISDDYVNLMIDFDKRFSEDELQVDETSTVIVKGRVYNDAIILNDGNSSITQETGTNCEYFIWSKSKGLLQYKYLDGEVYTFYKKLPYRQSWWKRKIIDVFY